MQGRAIVLLIILLPLHIFFLSQTGGERKSLPSDAGAGFVIPSPLLKITSFGFKGLVSDLLFVKAMVFDGETYERKMQPRMRPDEWKWFENMLTASTDLDPYFFDPYLLANSHLVWDGGLVRETNVLLEKGAKYRDEDWMLPFFIGFNSFFFLRENDKAAAWLLTASQKPGAPAGPLVSLAARLSYKERKTENAILFLDAIAGKTDDKRLKKEYETRLRALRARLLLEKGLASYREKFGKYPAALDQLILSGILKEIPQDPYGGVYSISVHGEIISTTDYLLLPRIHDGSTTTQ